MQVKEFYVWGESIDQDELIFPWTRSLAKAVIKFPFTTLLDVQRKSDCEGLIVEFQVQLPQYPPVPILNREHIAITFNSSKDDPPKVHALRKDFPETLHQNLSLLDEPKRLCLFDELYQDIKAHLTPVMLLQRIADWLARAAVEELHLSDQLLEPFLLGSGGIIFDTELFDLESKKERPIVAVDSLSDNPILLRAYSLPKDFDTSQLRDNICYLLLPVAAPPWHSRLINHNPQNLQQLSKLVDRLKVDIERQIRTFITSLPESANLEGFREHQLIVLLRLPKTRVKSGPVETPEWWAFLIKASIEELAVKLGIRGRWGENLGVIIGPPKSEELDTIEVSPLRPIFALSKPYARLLSGLRGDDPNVVAIGAGALGSQVILNLARQGFGIWTVVDHDFLLPHNLVRHALSFYYEGGNKAKAITHEIKMLMNNQQAARAFPSNILAQGEQREELHQALEACDLILDFSTSHAVSYTLAYADYLAGRMCAFLSPSGHHLIILYEGQERSIRLADLELQLAAAIAENRRFQNIYTDASGSVAYAGSCRDTSVQLPQDLVALHAALASQFIKSNAFTVEPSITIWKWSDIDLSVTRHQIPTHTVVIAQKNGWNIRMSSHVGNLMRYHRRRRLPNETGGVLLGTMNHETHTIYIATAFSSPSDSVEWPTAYIRGMQGLREKIETFSKVTGGDLSYVGEWHSHPEGCSATPSEDDHKAHEWLVNEMGIEGLPGLIVIQGEDIEPYFLIAPSA